MLATLRAPRRSVGKRAAVAAVVGTDCRDRRRGRPDSTRPWPVRRRRCGLSGAFTRSAGRGCSGGSAPGGASLSTTIRQ